MSYLAEVTLPLVRALEHFATLPAHQLAGHAANVEFWRSEVLHRRGIIQSYVPRFERMREAQKQYGSTHGFGKQTVYGWDEPIGTEPIASEPPLRSSTADAERQDSLRQLDQALLHFCERLRKEDLLDKGDAEP